MLCRVTTKDETVKVIRLETLQIKRSQDNIVFCLKDNLDGNYYVFAWDVYIDMRRAYTGISPRGGGLEGVVARESMNIGKKTVH